MEDGKGNNKTWCVYIHTNKINHKVYIGITSQTPEARWGVNGNQYKENQPVFYNAIQKYGWDNFEHIVWAMDLTKEEAINMEIKLIALYQANCKKYKNPEYGYNMTDGGEGNLGLVHSAKAKQIIGEKAKERYSQPENNPMFGKHHSEETKRKMSENRQGMNTGEDNSFYGKHHSEDAKQKMREYALNRPAEVKQKISRKAKERYQNPENNPMYGKSHTDEARMKISKAAKNRLANPKNNPKYGTGRHVIQLSLDNEYIAEYISADEVQRKIGIDRNNVRKCCNGKCKTAGGFKWMYKDMYDAQTTQN